MQERYTRVPDLEGPEGCAWIIKMPEKDAPPAWQASVGAWVVYQPNAHPFWHYWFVGACHLRHIEGAKPASKSYPKAAYEFQIIALDPEKPLPDIDGNLNGHRMVMLVPIDICIQFDGIDDTQATELVKYAVKAIVNGTMSPDGDFARLWQSALRGTIDHLQGKHARS